jgi:hypothetical protein
VKIYQKSNEISIKQGYWKFNAIYSGRLNNKRKSHYTTHRLSSSRTTGLYKHPKHILNV